MIPTSTPGKGCAGAPRRRRRKMMLLRMLRMRRAGAERGNPGSAWVCCWLLGWQAAALQLPPCEEVRFSSFSWAFPIRKGGWGARTGSGGGWHPINGVLLAPPKLSVGWLRGQTHGEGRTLGRGAGGGSGAAEPSGITSGAAPLARTALPAPLGRADRCCFRGMEIVESPSKPRGLGRPRCLSNYRVESAQRWRVREGWCVKLSRPPGVTSVCPGPSRACDMGRETLWLCAAVRTRTWREAVCSEQGRSAQPCGIRG